VIPPAVGSRDRSATVVPPLFHPHPPFHGRGFDGRHGHRRDITTMKWFTRDGLPLTSIFFLSNPYARVRERKSATYDAHSTVAQVRLTRMTSVGDATGVGRPSRPIAFPLARDPVEDLRESGIRAATRPGRSRATPLHSTPFCSVLVRFSSGAFRNERPERRMHIHAGGRGYEATKTRNPNG